MSASAACNVANQSHCLTWACLSSSKSLVQPQRCCVVCASGEAAKEVSKLALRRVRELQSAVEEARQEAGAKQARVSQLEAHCAQLEASANATKVRLGRDWGLWPFFVERVGPCCWQAPLPCAP